MFTKVKVVNGGVKVNGKCYIGADAGKVHANPDDPSSMNPLKSYENSIVIVEGMDVYEPHYIGGKFICKLIEVPAKHFKYYMEKK